jgi:aminopeptidase N
MPGQYWSIRLGRHAEDDYYLDEYQQYLQIDRQRRMPLASKGSNNIYPKGALVLRMLQRYLGPQRFWASIRRYLTDHAYGNANSDDLRQAVLAATGENLDWFWDEWVYQAGLPDFRVTATYDTSARSLTLRVAQTQTDSATADTTTPRFTTPQTFRMPVTIRIGTASGDVVQRTAIDQREQTVVFTALPGPPTMVVFDDGNTIVKKLTFDQPTGWLATQLVRDPDLWNRQWVIDRLAERGGDSAAVAALARAATSADYFRTRRAAALALAGAPAGLALPALERALSDTSAQVRAGAATALAKIADPRATTLARRAWEHDQSYEVRARSLVALARLDSAARRDLIATALATPSYRDAIALGAYEAIIQANDTSFIGQIDSAVGGAIDPSFVLAVLGARGSGHALDLLTAHLDDDRPSVRRWALIAMENALPDTLATPRLQGAQDTLRHADAREAVRQALGRLSNQKGHAQQ